MPRPVHEIPLVLLAEHPDWLSGLLVATGQPPLPAGAKVYDSVLRPEPVAPDLVVGQDDGPLVLVELQFEVDKRKLLRWPLAVAQVADVRGVMVDLVVLTPSKAVADWSRQVHHQGPLGTSLVLSPVVVNVDGPAIDKVLVGPPELAFFAAWAVAHRHGRRAREVVTRALGRARELPPEARAHQEDAIISVMSRRLAAALKEAAMGLEAYITEEAREIGRLLREREAKASERGREEGRNEGRNEGRKEGRKEGHEQGLLRAILALLSARGVPTDEAARAQLESCTDAARLERWVVRASTALRVEDVLEER